MGKDLGFFGLNPGQDRISILDIIQSPGANIWTLLHGNRNDLEYHRRRKYDLQNDEFLYNRICTIEYVYSSDSQVVNYAEFQISWKFTA